MHDNPSSSGPPHPLAVARRRANDPRAELTQIRGALRELARASQEMWRPLAARRTEMVILFVRQHDGDFARAGLPVDRRASLLLNSSLLREAAGWRNLKVVEALAAEIAMDLSAYLADDPGDYVTSTPEPPASRGAGLFQNIRRYWGTRDSTVGLYSGDAGASDPVEDGGPQTECDGRADVAPD